MEKEILFKETQKFTQWWIWLIMLVTIGMLIFVVFQIMKGQGSKSNSLPLKIIVSSGLFIIVPIVLLLVTMRLETQIRTDGIYVRFFPFHLSFKEYKWETISKSFVRQYSPIAEFGGWGLRFGPAGKAFNVSGDKGLQVEFNDNNQLLIGTNKPAELTETLKRIGQLKQ